MEKVGAEIFVSGRVQGVYFRAFTEKEANELGLAGYCRNLPDGRVFILAEGDRALIEELIKKLWIGPPRARVQDVLVTWKPTTGQHREFSIRYGEGD